MIVSGTTYDKIVQVGSSILISGGRTEEFVLRTGKGAYNYQITDDRPEIFASMIPDQEGLLKIHDICYAIHVKLLREYGLKTDMYSAAQITARSILWWKTTVETSFSCRATKWNICARF